MPADSLSFEQRFAAAMRLAQSGRAEDAARAFHALTRDAPRHGPSYYFLAMLLHRMDRETEALAQADAAAALMPDDASVAALRADVLLALDRVDDAAQAARRSLAIDPARIDARLSLGLALTIAGEWKEAREALATILSAQPDLRIARRALMRCCLQLGDADAALAAANYPALIDSEAELGAVLAEFAAAGAFAQNAELLRTRATRHPSDYQAALALAAALHRLGRVTETIDWCKRAEALRPAETRPIEIRATALIDRGDVETGIALYRDLLARSNDAEMSARHLVLMHYDPAQTNESLFAALNAYAKRHLRAFGLPFEKRRGERRELRVGWISPRFNDGPVASFLPGLLGAMDRTHHRHLLIALQPGRDATSERLQQLADEWIELSGLDDETLLRRLRDLELDVLIDLAGHSTANRLAVIAQRVAPVQVSWLDWFDTTAAPAIDAWFSDAWLTPSDSTQRYTERVIRLPSGRFCYTPPTDAPSASYAGDGRVRFSSFNRLAKLNDEVVETWADILARTQGSELHLGARLLDEPATRARILERFASHGIEAERLVLHGQRPYAALLDAYRSIDIALDPFPFSGCTTTCDALYMGCAVVTLPGETFVSRQSASLAWRLGRDEWVARDRADYVERAVKAAASVDSLRADREPRRVHVIDAICDATRQAQDFERVIGELVDAKSGA